MDIYITLPDERYRAFINTRNFLRRLLDPKATPRVPKEVRKEAYYCLKHYAAEYELEELAENSPSILRKKRGE